jgi:flagellar biosynthetic protein FliR
LDIFTLIQDHLGFFLLILARVSGIFTTAPVFGSRNIPVIAKIGLSFVITYLLTPVITRPPAIPEQFYPYIFTVIGEFVIGLTVGFAASLVFSAVQMAGQLLDMQIGFGIVNIFDPQLGQQVPLIGNFKYLLAIIVFLSINGHHVLLTALTASFNLIPLTGLIYTKALTSVIIDMVSGIFIIAFKISLPVLAAVFLTDIALGILARTMPQMNIFVVGVPGKIIVGIFVLSLALPFYIMFLEVAFNGMYSDVYRLLAVFAKSE